MFPLLDTHQHLIYPEIASYGWTSGSSFLKGKSFTFEDYKTAAKGLNIQASLFMETAVDEPDIAVETDFASKLASDSENNIKGLIATCRPETIEGFDLWLEKAPEFGIVGYRRILQNQVDEMSQTAVFRRNIREIGKKDLVFDLCMRAHQLPIAGELAKACDNTKIVLNHCGNPDIVGGEYENWSNDISALSRMPNMYCKLSGLMPKSVDGQFDFASIEPYVAHLLDTFGPKRMVWGSDWPVVNRAGGLALWGKVTHDILGRLSDSEAVAIAHGNAEQLYGV